MISRKVAVFAAAVLLSGQLVPVVARADNQMGYRLLSQQEAASLPHNQGALGLSIERSQVIADGGMQFDIIRVTQVRQGSAGARAGLKSGDEIIALDGRVFPTLIAFSDYVGAAQPGSEMTVDYMPKGGGPQKATRASVIVGQAGQALPPGREEQAPASTGMSTKEKIAIGAGAVALFGCYEAGCFSHHAKLAGQQVRQPDGYSQGQQPNGYQQAQPSNGYQQQGQQQPNAYQQGQQTNGYPQR